MKWNTHVLSLEKSYKKVGELTWLNNDFTNSSLQVSRGFFTDESLLLGSPIPKELDVYALLSGISFPAECSDKLANIQQSIDSIIGDSLHYWVKPLNFGMEYCVFKWPEDSWNDSWLPIIEKELNSLDTIPFYLNIHGIQINADGCVVAKGYDETGMIFKIREQLKANLEFLPRKQSNWAHIPIGRILEPIGSSKFLKLKAFIDKLNNTSISSVKIDSAKFVHETRWYMEERLTMLELKFSQNIV
jgi:hypothetical protein